MFSKLLILLSFLLLTQCQTDPSSVKSDNATPLSEDSQEKVSEEKSPYFQVRGRMRKVQR